MMLLGVPGPAEPCLGRRIGEHDSARTELIASGLGFEVRIRYEIPQAPTIEWSTRDPADAEVFAAALPAEAAKVSYARARLPEPPEPVRDAAPRSPGPLDKRYWFNPKGACGARRL